MLPEVGIIFDAGTGMFRVRDLIQTKTLDIFLSHIHLDHVIGLTFLYDVLYEKQVKRVTVHTTEENAAVIKQNLYHKKLFPIEPNFEFAMISDQSAKLETGGTMSAFPIDHPGGCHGFRYESAGVSMAYVTDTMAHDNVAYLNEIRGVRTLLHECYFPDHLHERAKLTGHSCLTPVAKVAKAAEVERVFLVHINPLDPSAGMLDLESAKSVFENITIATDEMVIDV